MKLKLEVIKRLDKYHVQFTLGKSLFTTVGLNKKESAEDCKDALKFQLETISNGYDLSKILSNSEFNVFLDVAYNPNDTFRNREKRIGVDKTAIVYHINNLCDKGLVTRNKGKYSISLKCDYCGKNKICVGQYPEGCFLIEKIYGK